jgi:hypothetical protein
MIRTVSEIACLSFLVFIIWSMTGCNRTEPMKPSMDAMNAGPGPQGTAIWFHPSVYSDDYFDLFTQDGITQWPRLRQRIDVFDGVWRWFADIASDQEMTNIGRFFARYPDIDLSFEGPVIKGQYTTCFAESCFSRNSRAIHRIRKFGGDVQFWISDESGFRALQNWDLYEQEFGYHFGSWEDVLDLAATVHDTAVGSLHSAYPTLIMGAVEPYPAMSVEEQFYWIDRLLAMENCDITFYHNGINGPAIQNGQGSLEELLTIEEYAESQGLVYGYMFKGYGDEKSDQEYYENAFTWWPQVEAVLGLPDHACFQHWYEWPKQFNLPETENYSYTQLVREYLLRWER